MYSPQTIFWDESLATGDRDLDTQHKYLFEICNDLAKAIEKKRGFEIIGMVLDVLTFYAEWHFKKEEDCMERYHCLVADKNQKAHSTFMARLREYHHEYKATEAHEALAVQIHQFLADWILNHILHMDTQLYPAIHHKPGSNNETHASTANR